MPHPVLFWNKLTPLEELIHCRKHSHSSKDKGVNILLALSYIKIRDNFNYLSRPITWYEIINKTPHPPCPKETFNKLYIDLLNSLKQVWFRWFHHFFILCHGLSFYIREKDPEALCLPIHIIWSLLPLLHISAIFREQSGSLCAV